MNSAQRDLQRQGEEALITGLTSLASAQTKLPTPPEEAEAMTARLAAEAARLATLPDYGPIRKILMHQAFLPQGHPRIAELEAKYRRKLASLVERRGSPEL